MYKETETMSALTPLAFHCPLPDCNSHSDTWMWPVATPLVADVELWASIGAVEHQKCTEGFERGNLDFSLGGHDRRSHARPRSRPSSGITIIYIPTINTQVRHCGWCVYQQLVRLSLGSPARSTWSHMEPRGE